MPRVRLRGRRGLERQAREQLVIALPQLPAPLDPAVEPRELNQPERRLDVGHVVFEPGLDRLVVAEPAVGEPLPRTGAQPVQGQSLHPLGDRRGVGEDRAALDRRDVLGGVEGEGGHVAPRPDPAPVPLRTDGVRRVLDHVNAVAIAQAAQPVHVDGPAGEMHGHDRPGARGDRRLGGVEVDEAVTGLAVEKDRGRPHVLDSIGRGHERHRGHEDLVAGPDVEHFERQRQGSGARGQTARIRGADVLREHVLEALHLGTGTNPSGAQRVHDLGDLGIADRWAPEDQKVLTHDRGVRVGTRQSQLWPQIPSVRPGRHEQLRPLKTIGADCLRLLENS